MKTDIKPRNIKHRHGTVNPIIQREEQATLAAVDRAVASAPNAQTIGRNGEIPVRDFLNRYLPYTLRAASGHFITPSGAVSPQIDILILDARYPLVAQNVDGSVLAMLHGVLACIEVKTTIRPRDVAQAWTVACAIKRLASEVGGYGRIDSWQQLRTDLLCYRSAARLGPVFEAWVKAGKPMEASLDLHLLRVPDRDQPAGRQLGAHFHFEPRAHVERTVTDDDWFPLDLLSWTTLSDFYYRLVQDLYYVLEARGFSFVDIGGHVKEYLSWSTYHREASTERPNPAQQPTSRAQKPKRKVKAQRTPRG